MEFGLYCMVNILNLTSIKIPKIHGWFCRRKFLKVYVPFIVMSSIKIRGPDQHFLAVSRQSQCKTTHGCGKNNNNNGVYSTCRSEDTETLDAVQED